MYALEIKEWITTVPEQRMKGLICRDPADLKDTVVGSKKSKPGINITTVWTINEVLEMANWYLKEESEISVP